MDALSALFSDNLGATGGVAVLLLLTWKLSSSFAALRQAITDLQGAIEGHLTRAELEAWVELMRAQNPTVKVPQLRRHTR